MTSNKVRSMHTRIANHLSVAEKKNTSKWTLTKIIKPRPDLFIIKGIERCAVSGFDYIQVMEGARALGFLQLISLKGSGFISDQFPSLGVFF